MIKDDFDETMSLSDILDEVDGFDFAEDEEDSLDEILVEFSDAPDTLSTLLFLMRRLLVS